MPAQTRIELVQKLVFALKDPVERKDKLRSSARVLLQIVISIARFHSERLP